MDDSITTADHELAELKSLVRGRAFMSHSIDDYIKDEMRVGNVESRQEAVRILIMKIKQRPVR